MQVTYRYSDIDLIAYFMTLGYEYNKIEITKKDNRNKVFAHFTGDKEDLLKIQEVYRSGESKVNILELSNNRKMIAKVFKDTINYHTNKIIKKEEGDC